MRNHSLTVLAGIGAAAVAAPALAGEASTGTLILDARARLEHFDTTSADATAGSVRVRLGWKQPLAKGLTGLVELEAVGAPIDDYADGVHPSPGRAVIPDPEILELNRASLTWEPSRRLGAEVGRQRIILGNSRYVGNIGWRENEQTFDGVRFWAKPNPGVTVTYAYVSRVNRPLGTKSPQGVWRGDVHLAQIETDLGAIGKASVFALLTDFDNAASQSTQTLGARLAGARAIRPGLSATWELEHARQGDHGANPQRVSVNYDQASIGLKTAQTQAALVVERLEGDGVHAFQTPLGSLHGFQGRSDVIGATPGVGVRDVFLRGAHSFRTKVPVKLSGELHQFNTTVGDDRLGREVDIVIAAPVAKGWSLEAGLARFDSAARLYPDATRAWLSLEFKL